ncbi:MAG TPA: phosphotransferase, partial [Anaerolineales bacterium]|nr:phosphotransferase [Anaerolineales bacterium]
RFNTEVLEEFTKRYNIPSTTLKEVGGFESFIYEYKDNGQAYILRITHSGRRSQAMILGEVDWINYLVEGGAGASQVINSKDGALVELVQDGHGEYFISTVFEKAPGVPPDDFGWSDALFKTIGKTVGKLHSLTKAYIPKNAKAYRPQWDDPIILANETWLPEGEGHIFQKYQEIIEFCHTLPQIREEYGLVHFDIHSGNFFVDEDSSIHLFDFDDCHYSWFANDIAIALFYRISGAKRKTAFIDNFMKHFISGYQTENNFRAEWLDLIPMFLKQREIDLYAVVHRSFDMATTDNKWALRYMDGRREKIENDVPFVKFDFRRLEKYLSQT